MNEWTFWEYTALCAEYARRQPDANPPAPSAEEYDEMLRRVRLQNRPNVKV